MTHTECGYWKEIEEHMDEIMMKDGRLGDTDLYEEILETWVRKEAESRDAGEVVLFFYNHFEVTAAAGLDGWVDWKIEELRDMLEVSKKEIEIWERYGFDNSFWNEQTEELEKLVGIIGGMMAEGYAEDDIIEAVERQMA